MQKSKHQTFIFNKYNFKYIVEKIERTKLPIMHGKEPVNIELSIPAGPCYMAFYDVLTIHSHFHKLKFETCL